MKLELQVEWIGEQEFKIVAQTVRAPVFQPTVVSVGGKRFKFISGFCGPRFTAFNSLTPGSELRVRSPLALYDDRKVKVPITYVERINQAIAEYNQINLDAKVMLSKYESLGINIGNVPVDQVVDSFTTIVGGASYRLVSSDPPRIYKGEGIALIENHTHGLFIDCSFVCEPGSYLACSSMSLMRNNVFQTTDPARPRYLYTLKECVEGVWLAATNEGYSVHLLGKDACHHSQPIRSMSCALTQLEQTIRRKNGLDQVYDTEEDEEEGDWDGEGN